MLSIIVVITKMKAEKANPDQKEGVTTAIFMFLQLAKISLPMKYFLQNIYI